TVLNEIDREATVAGLGSSASFSVFVSSESTASDGAVSATIGAASTSALGLSTTSFTTASGAQGALAQVTSAISTLGNVQNTVGTLENRLQFAIGLANSQMTNAKAAESRIRDANVAEESANMTKYNILTQAGIAALSQANQTSSSVLAL